MPRSLEFLLGPGQQIKADLRVEQVDALAHLETLLEQE